MGLRLNLRPLTKPRKPLTLRRNPPLFDLILILALAQQPKIITCTIVEPYRSVSCNGEIWEFNGEIDEWKWQAPLRNGKVNVDAPLIEVEQKAGQQVKAIIERGLTPVSPCEVRVWRGIKAWRMFKEGEMTPETLYTLPDDCQPWYRD